MNPERIASKFAASSTHSAYDWHIHIDYSRRDITYIRYDGFNVPYEPITLLLICAYLPESAAYDRARRTWSYRCRSLTQTLRAYILTSCFTWNQAKCNNAWDRDRNSWYNFHRNFRKYRPKTRQHQFLSTDHCTRWAFGWRIAAWKIIRAVVTKR